MSSAAEDPRALLRAARKERRITHPHASYTSSGSLICNLCECSIKSEAAWGAHLHSTGHTLRLSRAQDAAKRSDSGEANGKKRKAESSVERGEGVEEDRKRQRPSDGETTNGASTDVAAPAVPEQAVPVPPEDSLNHEAELAALEADLQAMEREARVNSATISAPALTAEQIAAQAREEQSAQRNKRDLEIEDEKEEAEQRLQEEFAEMEGLEDRVRKLRERREKLRAGSTEANTAGPVEVVDGGGHGSSVAAEVLRAEEQSEDEEEDADFDGWGFGSE